MKVLVTGATGFTGSHLARKLYDLNYDVRVIVREKSKIEQSNNFEPEIIEGDIRDTDVVKRAVKGVKMVFNIAAIFRTAGNFDKVYWETHVNGTQNLLNASKKNNIERFIHCSTVGVHGHIENPPADETYPFNPADIYQVTKLKGELNALKYHMETNLPLTVIRPCSIYGPGDMRLLKLFRLCSNNITPILGDGNIFYHMVYIDDLVDAFILAAENKVAIGEVFIVGGSECYTLNQIIDLIVEKNKKMPFKLYLPAKPFQLLGSLCESVCIPLGINPPIYRRRVDFFTKSRSFDISKIKKYLNFEPKYSLKEGLEATRTWYYQKGLL